MNPARDIRLPPVVRLPFGRWLAALSVVAGQAAPPGPASALTVSARTATSISLQWTAPSPEASPPVELYRILYTPVIQPGAEWIRAFSNTNGALVELAHSTAYDIRVVAINADGEGPPSPPLTATTLLATPAAPVGLRLGTLSATQAALSWQPLLASPAHGPATMHVITLRDGVTHALLNTLFSVSPSLTLSGLGADHPYEATVVGRNSAGDGPPSTVAFRTHRPAPVLTAVVASDPDDQDAVFGPGDRLTLTFDQDTNRPEVGRPEDVSNLISFSSAGDSLWFGAWLDARTLALEVAQAGSAPAPGVEQVLLRPEGGLRVASGLSPPSTSSLVVSGNWGAPAAPVPWVGIVGPGLGPHDQPRGMSIATNHLPAAVVAQQWTLFRDGTPWPMAGVAFDQPSLVLPAASLPAAGADLHLSVTDANGAIHTALPMRVAMTWPPSIQLLAAGDTTGTLAWRPQSESGGGLAFHGKLDSPPASALPHLQATLWLDQGPGTPFVPVSPGLLHPLSAVVANAYLWVHYPGGLAVPGGLQPGETRTLRWEVSHRLSGEKAHLDFTVNAAGYPGFPPAITGYTLSADQAYVRLDFDQATNQPPAADAGDLDALFETTHTFGANPAGFWLGADRLLIRLGSGAAPQPGFSRVWLRDSGGFRDALSLTAVSTSRSPPLVISGQNQGPVVRIVAPDQVDAGQAFLLLQSEVMAAGPSPVSYAWECGLAGALAGLDTGAPELLVPVSRLPPGQLVTFTLRASGALGLPSETDVHVVAVIPSSAQRQPLGLLPSLLPGFVGTVLPAGYEVARFPGTAGAPGFSCALVAGEGDQDNARFQFFRDPGQDLALRNVVPLDLTITNRFPLRVHPSAGEARAAVLVLERGDMDAWRRSHFPGADFTDPVEEATGWGDHVDLRGGMVPNFLRYALGQSPVEESGGARAVPRGGTPRTVEIALATDPQLVVEAAFASLPAFSEGLFQSAVATTNGATTVHHATDPSSSSSRYARLRVRKTP